MIFIDIQTIKQHINTSTSRIKNYKKQLATCTNGDLRAQLLYKLKQEEIKLESFDLLLFHYQKMGLL